MSVPSALCLALALLPTAVAVRSADVGDAIAADLLVHSAADRDIGGAWRVLRSARFSPAWLTTRGQSSRETPVEAALRECRSELVGLIVTHPDFDWSGMRKNRERRELIDYAFNRSACLQQDTLWALCVMRTVQLSKPQQEDLLRDSRAVMKEEAWFLPQPLEWFAPASLQEMGYDPSVRPWIPTERLQDLIASNLYFAMLANASRGKPALTGAGLRVELMRKMWVLAVSHVRAPRYGMQLATANRNLRSIGWSLFFRGSRQALLVHYMVLDYLASHLTEEDLPPASEESLEHLRTLGSGARLDYYRGMALALDFAWDKLGTWAP